MSFAKTWSVQSTLLKAHPVSIEVDLSKGLHAFSIVGMPDKAVEEAKDRMAAAIKNTGFKSPKAKNQKIVISLAPAQIKKEGPQYDLPMALAYLLAAADIEFDFEKKVFLGELSLDGELRPIVGVLPLVIEAKDKGFKEVYVPTDNAKEAALVDGIKIFPCKSLADVIDHLTTDPPTIKVQPRTVVSIEDKINNYEIDFQDIKGQETAKRGLEIAAAGGHNVALYGPPGTGKTMLAKAFRHILPPLSFDESIETTSIHSIAGALDQTLITQPPLRAPHHTSSYVSLVGGGAIPKPGEITLAHRGILFMDEFPEFDRKVIDALRQPLEDRVISISRAKGTAHFPADFILIASMNPCPCGNFGTAEKECHCSPHSLQRYQKKISGPIIDRIDLWIKVSHIDHKKILDRRTHGEDTAKIAHRVRCARGSQNKRFKAHGLNITTNNQLSSRHIEHKVDLSDDVKSILNQSAAKLSFSPRVYHRIIKVSRTIADLEGKPQIEVAHILEAIQYRPKDNFLG